MGEVGSLWILHIGKAGLRPGSPIEAERRIILMIQVLIKVDHSLCGAITVRML
jgi:hypothetical protein